MKKTKHSLVINSSVRPDYELHATYTLESEIDGKKTTYCGITFRSRTMRNGTVRTYGYEQGSLKEGRSPRKQKS